MPSKQTARREAAKELNDLSFRALPLTATTADETARSVAATIATEAPVVMPDPERKQMIPEVLRMDGAQFPEQVPLLDNHQRKTMANQLGSVRNIRREGDGLTGTLRFANGAETAWSMVREGHFTDVSAGYLRLEKRFVPRGRTELINGRSYTGPVNVITKWKLREVSLTPIGADEQAKLRGFDPTALPEEKDFSMNPELRSLLETRGMPKELSDEEAQRWAVEHKLGERKEDADSKTLLADFEVRMQRIVEDASNKAATKAIEETAKRSEELRGIADNTLHLACVTRTRALDDKLAGCRSREDIEKAVLDHREEQEKTFGTRTFISAGPAQVDKFEKQMKTALVLRSLDSIASPVAEHEQDNVAKRREAARERIFPVAEQDKDSAHFRAASLFDMAREYVEKINGVRTFEMTREEIAHFALLGPQRACEILGIRDAGAYHTTGSFANITMDAINKSMALGYTEAPSTWEQVMRVGSDFVDFKAKNVFLLGAVPNLPVWNDNKDPEKASFADAKESYSVECRSYEVDFSYRLLINDDMSALSRIPAQLGNAARRTVNAVAWSIITSNPTMRDGQALFSTVTGNRKRLNLTTGAGAPSTTTLQTLTNLMMQMRGENTPEQAEGADILNLIPRYIIGPSALRTTILQLVMSVYDNVATGSLAYNMASQLIPVIEPLLDSASTTAWYLAADTAQIDTVEVSFLQGQRTPVTRQFIDPRKLSQSYIILQSFGAKALNWRGLQKHAGA
ncbi:MAG: hypothetical protein A3E01_10810 [Gammaproteobacteria bacterium RIFCSPHIGHO2_12_FULL_63_22]|nr:MAG: hypothetical protein A3E01_10810 [Gammaproteobacteria bacterium RIFCSPHIGHO2_12_FULL_63_22]